MKYGLHFRSWDGIYSENRMLECMREAKAIGAHTFEVFPPDFVLKCDTQKIRDLKKQIDEIGIELLLTCKFEPDMDLGSENPENRRRGIDFLKRYIEGAAELGAKAIGGIVYSVWPHMYGNDMIDKAIKRERTMHSIESMRKIVPTAEACQITLNAEMVNRFEHYMLNTAEEGIKYCRAVESDRLCLLFDVFHANIEEDSIEDAIRSCKGKIGHVHVSEANRGIPYRESRLDWKAYGRALRDINYTGTVTLEPILLCLGKASYNSRLFRDLIIDPTLEARLRYLKEGLSFIRSTFEEESEG